MPDSSPRPHAVLSAPGSRGDVNPMLALGQGLRRAGFDVTIMLAEPYAPLAERSGLQPVPLVSRSQFDALVHNPHLWHPIGGPRVLLADLIPGTLEDHYRAIEAMPRLGPTVLVAHPLDIASRIFRDAHPEVPLVSIHLAPAILRTPGDPPRLTASRLEPRRSPSLVRLAYWMADRCLIDRWLTPPLNRFRSSLGLPPVDRPLDRWALSPDRAIGLYPDWYAPDASHWPSVFRTAGFPLHDGPASDDAPDVDQVLAHFDAPPIVFTPGTANVRAARFFEAAVEVCRRLRRPGLMLTGEPAQVPHARPGWVRVASYLPLGELLPRCAAIAHHGGIGTTSQALAAGVPQLICPMAFDQFDNGDRVGRLGCGRVLPMRRLTVGRLQVELRTLLADATVADRSAEISRRVEPGERAIGRAVQEIANWIP